MTSGYAIRMRRSLPSLTALATFEAAARLMSFTRAAEELGVTQAAVSRQINLLETHLGVALFRRLHRRIELTERGHTLGSVVTQAMAQIAQTVKAIAPESEEDEFVISATVAFSHFWLLPRISDFRQHHPALKLRILSQDSATDLTRGGVDVTIRYGEGNWADGRGILLFGDEVFPVASPDYRSAAGPPQSLDDLAQCHLISYDAEETSWIGWEEWLAAFDRRMSARQLGLRCSSYIDSIYAALNGQGVAIGWRQLIGDLLVQKRLVRVTEEVLETRNGYFVVVPERRRKGAATEAFLDWLREKIAMDQRQNR
jgi:DNA-binding transcriptional LysR family regulator